MGSPNTAPTNSTIREEDVEKHVNKVVRKTIRDLRNISSSSGVPMLEVTTAFVESLLSRLGVDLED